MSGANDENSVSLFGPTTVNPLQTEREDRHSRVRGIVARKKEGFTPLAFFSRADLPKGKSFLPGLCYFSHRVVPSYCQRPGREENREKRIRIVGVVDGGRSVAGGLRASGLGSVCRRCRGGPGRGAGAGRRGGRGGRSSSRSGRWVCLG